MPYRKITPEQENEIVRRYQELVSTPTLALEYDVVPNTIRKILKEHGVVPRTVEEAQQARWLLHPSPWHDRNAYHRDWYHNLPDEKLENRKKRGRAAEQKHRAKMRAEIIEVLGGKCRRCGFSDIRALQIDHVNGGGKVEVVTIGKHYQYYKGILEQLRGGTDKYQLLCANCNWIKRYENKEV